MARLQNTGRASRRPWSLIAAGPSLKTAIVSFESKAPEYDFALYEPYGDNPYYGVMMASWVPRDVALEALRLARRDVARDAYLWACRSSGESC